MQGIRLHAASTCPCSIPAAPRRPAAGLRLRRCAVLASSQWPQDASSGERAGTSSALLIEVDGALTDLHMDGHRQAFNHAFKELGLECTNWTSHVYNDLLSQGDGTGEGLVTAYFSTVGWPMFLPTSEQDLFASKVHGLKQQQLKRMLQEGKVPLRFGVQQVIDDALAAGTCVACLSETLSAPTDEVASSLMKLLGSQRAQQIRMISASLHDGALRAAQQEEGLSLSWEQSLSEASARAKQQVAEALVAEVGRAKSNTNQTASIMQGIAVDPNLLTAASRSSIQPAWLRAVATTLSVPCSRCVVVAANTATVSAAAGAGMVAVALPRRLAHGATFAGARAKFEGWGPGLATWPRLASLLPQQQ